MARDPKHIVRNWSFKNHSQSCGYGVWEKKEKRFYLFPRDRHNMVLCAKQGNANDPLRSSTSTFISFCKVFPLFFQSHWVFQVLWGWVQKFPLLSGIKHTLAIFTTSFSQGGHGVSVKKAAGKSDKYFSILHIFYKGLFTAPTVQSKNKLKPQTKPNKSSKRTRHTLPNSTCNEQC